MKFRARRNVYRGPAFLSFEICLTRNAAGVTIGMGHTDYVLEVYRDDEE